MLNKKVFLSQVLISLQRHKVVVPLGLSLSVVEMGRCIPLQNRLFLHCLVLGLAQDLSIGRQIRRRVIFRYFPTGK